MKNWLHFISLRFSHHSGIIGFSKPSHIFEAEFHVVIKVLAKVRLVEHVQAISEIHSMLKQVSSGVPDGTNIKPGFQDGSWYTEYNGTTLVTISQILLE